MKETLSCKRCGEAFEKRRPNQLFCDADCQYRYNAAVYQKRRRARKREQAQSNRSNVLHQPDDRANSSDRGVELELPSGERY